MSVPAKTRDSITQSDMDSGWASRPAGRLLNALDRPHNIPPSWRATLAKTLLSLLEERAEVDRVILRSLSAHIRAGWNDLSEWAQQYELGKDVTGRDNQDDHPVAHTLLTYSSSEQTPVGVSLLLALMCEAALSPHHSDHHGRLAGMIRGALEPSDRLASIRLRDLIGDCRTLPELQARVETHLEVSNEPSHQGFVKLWKSWLGPKLRGWMHGSGRSLNLANAPPLTPSLEVSEILLDSSETAEPDDGLSLPAGLSDPYEPGEAPRSNGSEMARARVHALTRHSQVDLLSPPDHILPETAVIKLVRLAFERATQLQAAGEPGGSEPYVALLLGIASGLHETVLIDVSWQSGRNEKPYVEWAHPFLHRPVVRPPNAVDPDPSLAPWLLPADNTVHWPLPESLHTLLVGLTEGETPLSGKPVLPRLAGEVARPYRLNDVMRELQPQLHIGASVCRLVLASHLAQRLGPDVAQLVLGDTFSMSAAPTYYTAPRHLDLTKQVQEIQTRWFGPSATSHFISNTASDGHVGSRLVLTDTAARHWPKLLRQKRRSLAHRRDATDIDAWIQHRDFLGASLAAATAHRPVDALADLFLSDVIPEYGLVVLRDKQIDPLRTVRVAATGARWTTELRDFLDRLIAIAANVQNSESSQLAAAILRCEAPLFDTPDQGGRRRFTAACLRETMPEPLQAYANHHRHRLNQQLQLAVVDPELRFAQLGWVVSEAHATADLSPLSARDLAKEIGPHIDDILQRDGWFGSSQRISPWRWDGIPLTPLRDWQTIALAHGEAHRLEIKKVRATLHEKGKEMREGILPRLGNAIRDCLPELRLEKEGRRLIRAPGATHRKPVTIDEEHCVLIEERVRSGSKHSSDTLEKLMTRIELARLIKRAHRDGITQGFIPRQPFVSFTSEPSPFLPGIGIAVRHAELTRKLLIDRCHEGRVHDQGPLAYLATVFFSPYRSAVWAEAALKGASRAARGQQPGDVLRIDTLVDRRPTSMVFSGIAAILLSRRGTQAPTALPPTPERLKGWLEGALPTELTPSDQNLVDAVIESARVAGRLELSGPERLLMLGTTRLTCVPLDRCLALSDQWPVRTVVMGESHSEKISPVVYEQRSKAGKTANIATAGYKELVRWLNPSSLAKQVHKGSDNRRGVRQVLIQHLQARLGEAGATTNLGLVVGYALHRLRYGGLRKPTLEISSIQTNVTRFARALLDVAGPRPLLDMDDDTLRHTYMAVLQVKAAKTRPLTLETLKQFHSFLELTHQRQPMNYTELQSFAGLRIDDADPGLLTPAEIDAVYDTLLKDLHEERVRPDASPEFIRIAELRILRFLLLEASGARPASIHGLLLDDVMLFGEDRDCIHIHRTGGYGSAKSNTTLGFVSLEGPLWKRAREWVNTWLQIERQRLAPDASRNIPLFANAPGSHERYATDMIEGRIGDLLRWVTSEPGAHTYWLRKARVQARHRQAVTSTKPLARHVQAALRQCGHAQIGTPLASYLHDPSIPMAHSLHEGRHTPRAKLFAITGLKDTPMDMAWQRKGGPKADARLSVVFDRLDIKVVTAPRRAYAPPPSVLHRHKLLPTHIHQFACAMQKVNNPREAALHVKLSGHQVERLQQAALALLGQRGCVPWCIDGLRHPHAVMKIPRNLQGAETFLNALGRMPSEALLTLAQDWGKTGHASRIVMEPNVLPLTGTASVTTARRVFEELGVKEHTLCFDEGGPLPFVTIARPVNRSQQQLTLLSALQWLLAMIWLHNHMLTDQRQP